MALIVVLTAAWSAATVGGVMVVNKLRGRGWWG